MEDCGRPECSVAQSIEIADIDSSLDYVHANFGGNGRLRGIKTIDRTPTANFNGIAKSPGGYDLFGGTPITRIMWLQAHLTQIPTPLTATHPAPVRVQRRGGGRTSLQDSARR